MVSVILPTYNRAHVLRDAIESALRQNGVAVEVIVADDGSTDGTRALVEEYAGQVVYLRQERRGAAAARNLAIEAARGEYLAFLDSDDVWLPGKVAAEMECFAQFPEADVIASDADSWRDGRLLTASWLQSKGLAVAAEPYLLPVQSGLWLQGSRFATCSLTLRGREFFDPALARFEDWEWEIRLFHHRRILVLPRLLSHIRRFDDGTRLRMPGADPSPEESRRDLEVELAILERALALGWPEEIEAEIRAKCVRHQVRLA